MLFYHLFCRQSLVLDFPLAHLLSKACNPVSLYLILSGYGFYVSKHKRSYKKLLLLYINYWLTMIVFVALGSILIGTSKYPGSIYELFLNVTGLKTTYNGEIWFLLPYVLLSLSSITLTKITDKINPIIVLVISIVLSTMAGWMTPRLQIDNILLKSLINNAFYYFNLLPSFFIGYYLAKYECVTWIRAKLLQHNVASKESPIQRITGGGYLLACTLFAIVLIIRLLDIVPYFHLFYCCTLCVFISIIPLNKYLSIALSFLGKHSTSIWFVHSYYCYYLFSDFIYSFKYPPLIFLVLVIVSIATALCFDYVMERLYRIVIK